MADTTETTDETETDQKPDPRRVAREPRESARKSYRERHGKLPRERREAGNAKTTKEKTK